MNAAAFDFCLQVADAHARLQRKLDDELGTWHGVSFADFRLLSALVDAPADGLTSAELAKPLGVQPSGVVRQVAALEKSGWVERRAEAGRRCVALRAPGRRLQREAAETAASICADALGAAHALDEAQSALRALTAARALDLR